MEVSVLNPILWIPPGPGQDNPTL
ncbi:uncharacterized protein G2W53_011984 [Senna tora]|uniref:Uncharacterized protein n=1 Tax=Senna tora TaxID=362788 RepID=A0A834U010_9FABA|nr:uncharacterized protein G2W53_011984 [Senna tora]